MDAETEATLASMGWYTKSKHNRDSKGVLRKATRFVRSRKYEIRRGRNGWWLATLAVPEDGKWSKYPKELKRLFDDPLAAAVVFELNIHNPARLLVGEPDAP